MPKRNVAVRNSSKSQVSRFPPTGNRTYAGNLGAGRTTAEVAPISRIEPAPEYTTESRRSRNK